MHATPHRITRITMRWALLVGLRIIALGSVGGTAPQWIKGAAY